MVEAQAPVIALLTDFGQRDWYVTSVKAGLVRACPAATLIDITHLVEPGDTTGAAFILAQCWQEFPLGTVFLGVVDPGVGTARKPIAVRSGDYTFVGPDNGLFGFLSPHQAWEISNTEIIPPPASQTFHGRDTFAPATGYLARGGQIDALGDKLEAIVPTAWPEPEFFKQGVSGSILAFDHFGNAITNLTREAVEAHFPEVELHVSLHPDRIALVETYAQVPKNAPLAYFGSGGALELAVNGGSARETLRLRLGQTVELLT